MTNFSRTSACIFTRIVIWNQSRPAVLITTGIAYITMVATVSATKLLFIHLQNIARITYFDHSFVQTFSLRYAQNRSHLSLKLKQDTMLLLVPHDEKHTLPENTVYPAFYLLRDDSRSFWYSLHNEKQWLNNKSWWKISSLHTFKRSSVLISEHVVFSIVSNKFKFWKCSCQLHNSFLNRFWHNLYFFNLLIMVLWYLLA